MQLDAKYLKSLLLGFKFNKAKSFSHE